MCEYLNRDILRQIYNKITIDVHNGIPIREIYEEDDRFIHSIVKFSDKEFGLVIFDCDTANSETIIFYYGSFQFNDYTFGRFIYEIEKQTRKGSSES